MDNQNITDSIVGDSGNPISGLKSSLKKHIVYLSLIPTVIVGILATNYYYKYNLIKNDPQKMAQQENQQLVTAVSKLILLPDDESPTIATVTDPEKLKDQVFFSKAQKGDKLLIYANAGKVILYNPETNKILDIAPINTTRPAPQISPSP